MGSTKWDHLSAACIQLLGESFNWEIPSAVGFSVFPLFQILGHPNIWLQLNLSSSGQKVDTRWTTWYFYVSVCDVAD